MKLLCLLIFGFLLAQQSLAQNSPKDTIPVVSDSIQKAKVDSIQQAIKDSIKGAEMEAKLIYPVIKAGTWSGVLPVPDADEIPDPKMPFKLLFELTEMNKKPDAKDINHGLTEICRKINLHAASGIPVKNIIPVIVIHGGALFAFLTNEEYQKKYKIDNPNIAIIEELIKKTGVKLIACGQAMQFLELTRMQLIPQMKVSLTAQTVLSNYQLKGYKLYEISED